jgi:hypothetical protein
VQEVADDVSYAASSVPDALWSALEAVVRQE